MHKEIALEEVIEFVRHWHGISTTKAITADTFLEKDLGITGDDGVELLEALEKRFGISFSDGKAGLRPAFGLAANEFLFHSEGFGLLAGLFRKLFGLQLENVRPLTVGRLHCVIQERQS